MVMKTQGVVVAEPGASFELRDIILQDPLPDEVVVEMYEIVS
jgi:Zn-dependent alcohol dehydrogenase